MDDDSDDSIDAMYDSGNDTSKASATDYALSAHQLGYTMDRWDDWPADAGTQNIYITYSAKWSEVLDHAAPRCTIWCHNTPELTLKPCASAVLLARKDIDAALCRLSDRFSSMNEGYLTVHAWCGQFLQLLLPVHLNWSH